MNVSEISTAHGEEVEVGVHNGGVNLYIGDRHMDCEAQLTVAEAHALIGAICDALADL